MMSPKRFVIVRQVDRWEEKESAGDSGFPTDPLAEYAKNPVPSTCLVLVADKLDGRRKLALLGGAEVLRPACAVIEVAALQPHAEERYERCRSLRARHARPEPVAHRKVAD